MKNMEPRQTQIRNKVFQLEESKKKGGNKEKEKEKEKRKNLKREVGYGMLFVKGEKKEEKG